MKRWLKAMLKRLKNPLLNNCVPRSCVNASDPAGTDLKGIQKHLIVGLGNPGPTYATTRHNIGFLVIDRIIDGHELVDCGNRSDVAVARGTVAGLSALTAKPMTYMNRSGGPVADIIDTCGIQFEDMVVIHDDIDLAYGRLKIKEKGGDGGHNGLRSLIDTLGTDQFIRVRMGVGRPEVGIGVVEYVLGEFDPEQRSRLEPFLSRGVAAVEAVLCEGARDTMNRFNRKT
ncbi:MAG: aminoacyl-tRNA hydrolase [Proteobacteria bacterium]|nr:MAG: aminoacyl-tRNA hydrolase [Pseudomonadota bacterium]